MSAGEVPLNVRDHGTALKEINRVQCNYCGKTVTSFSRLKYHLGGIRGDVTPCEKVPDFVKQSFRNLLLEAKKENLNKEVGDLNHPNLPLKRKSLYPKLRNAKQIKRETTQTAAGQSGLSAEINPATESSMGECHPLPTGSIGSESAENDAGNEDSPSQQAQKHIAKFFYETGIDFSVANSPSFEKLINVVIVNGHLKYKIPGCHELKGWMFQEELKDMREYVDMIKSSWPRTGCSILLDAWIDKKDRNLVSFIVDCPEGPVYLRSADVSDIVRDVDALKLLLDGVIEEVGADNVVQILACSNMVWMSTVNQKLIARRKTIAWSLSASYCIGVMLEKIMEMHSVQAILEKAKTISKFIHSDVTTLKLLKEYTHVCCLIKPSKVRAAMPFMTMENMLLHENKLKNMFSSSEWRTSIGATTREGQRVADLVWDDSFWTEAEMVVKATIPVVRALCLINEADEPQVGFIYETMDQVKETIKEELKHKKSLYNPFWKLIDEIWNNRLHIPLQAAGYFLNPAFLYANENSIDHEVSSGLHCCIARMVEDHNTRAIIECQLVEYRHAKGDFSKGKAADQEKLSPANWWYKYGKSYPQLQRFAVKVLSQTCEGASRYGLRRNLAEKLLTEGRNHDEQQELIDLAFVHYNLQLQHSKLGKNRDITAIEIDPSDDWCVPESTKTESQNVNSMQMELDSTGGAINREEPNELSK